MTLFVVAAPAVALRAGYGEHRASVRVERVQHAEYQPTEAVLLEDAARPGSVAYPAAAGLAPARAAWTAPDGTPRSGTIKAGAWSAAGSTVPTRTDRSGHQVAPPRRHDQTLARAWTSAVLIAVEQMPVLAVAWWLIRRPLDHRRLAGRQAAWERTGPQWTGRRP